MINVKRTMSYLQLTTLAIAQVVAIFFCSVVVYFILNVVLPFSITGLPLSHFNFVQAVLLTISLRFLRVVTSFRLIVGKEENGKVEVECKLR